MSLPNPSMSFSPFAILTAEEMNDLVENIESLADGSGLNDGVVTVSKLDPAVIALDYTEIGRTTLASAADAIDIPSLATYSHLRIEITVFNSGSIQQGIRFNGDTGTNYTYAISSENSGTYSTGTSVTTALMNGAISANSFTVLEIINTASKPKQGKFVTTRDVSAASSVMGIRTGALVWVNTLASISSLSVVNSSTGDFAAGSEVIVYGHN